MKWPDQNQDLGIFILRILVGGLLIPHGLNNLFTRYTFIKAMMIQSGLPEFIRYGAFVGEILAPILMIIGYQERWASLLVMITMFVAIMTTHSSEIFALNQYGGWAIELQAFYLFGSMTLFFTGGGRYVLRKT